MDLFTGGQPFGEHAQKASVILDASLDDFLGKPLVETAVIHGMRHLPHEPSCLFVVLSDNGLIEAPGPEIRRRFGMEEPNFDIEHAAREVGRIGATRHACLKDLSLRAGIVAHPIPDKFSVFPRSSKFGSRCNAKPIEEAVQRNVL